MGTYKAKCDICHAENEVPNYGDWACSQCGQRYDYDEGHRIRLSDAQLQALRFRWIPVSERVPKIGEHVLACWVQRKDGMATAVRRELNGKAVWSAADQWNEIDPPIAWMRLPEPPEVK